MDVLVSVFFFQAEDGIRDIGVTGVQTCALPIFARRCEVQVAYAIGAAHPVGLFVETFGTNTVPEDALEKAITSVFDLRPGAIVRDLDLLRPIYAPTAAYGHFGRTDVELPWERLDRVDALKSALAV